MEHLTKLSITLRCQCENRKTDKLKIIILRIRDATNGVS